MKKLEKTKIQLKKLEMLSRIKKAKHQIKWRKTQLPSQFMQIIGKLPNYEITNQQEWTKKDGSNWVQNLQLNFAKLSKSQLSKN